MTVGVDVGGYSLSIRCQGDGKASAVGGDLRVVTSHRNHDRKLSQTGVRSLLVGE
jgi:hypothetical protein